KKDYPTVVIGAGIGGLTCAAFLARQGIPVTVVEQHNIPGGYATSFDRDGGRFTFEVSLHATAVGDNSMERICRRLGLMDRVEFAELPECYTLMLPGLTVRVPQKDPAAYIQILSEHFPAEKKGITDFVNLMVEAAEEGSAIARGNPRFEGLWFYLKFPLKCRRMLSLWNRTLAEVVGRHVKDPVLKDVLVANWAYYGLPPSRLSAFYFMVPTGDYLKNGAFYIKDRSQNFSNALADIIEENGGRILYNTPAEKIQVKDGAVCGVEAGGELLPARAVVSNASALTTVNQLLPPGACPESYVKKLNNYPVSLSSFIVWLGLNQDITDRIKDYEIFVSTGRGAEEDYKSFLVGDVENGAFLVAIYDNAFKGYSKPGTSTVTLVALCGFDPWEPFFADYKTGKKDAYNAQKKAWTDTLIRRTEKHVIPGLADMIEVQDSATPLTNWSYTSHPRGAVYGFDHDLSNDFVNRVDNRTPVDGLYLSGAWSRPGAGYAGVLQSGEITFLKMMKDWGA
ncbi:MAG: NAD(P)/FAD-dependent oxidoreductase, partial [Proteobacteria bacterium]|nr:NAD(P)/FAD-dependent oxidoreductase [Pseudomonadota bacterium]